MFDQLMGLVLKGIIAIKKRLIVVDIAIDKNIRISYFHCDDIRWNFLEKGDIQETKPSQIVCKTKEVGIKLVPDQELNSSIC